MIMEIFYKPPFRKFVKKQTRSFQLVVEDKVEEITISPNMGESKKGDLTGFRVHKFSYGKQKFLIAYRFKQATIVFFMIGTHENFHHELKRYLREAG